MKIGEEVSEKLRILMDLPEPCLQGTSPTTHTCLQGSTGTSILAATANHICTCRQTIKKDELLRAVQTLGRDLQCFKHGGLCHHSWDAVDVKLRPWVKQRKAYGLLQTDGRQGGHAAERESVGSSGACLAHTRAYRTLLKRWGSGGVACSGPAALWACKLPCLMPS